MTDTERERLREQALRLLYPEVDIRGSIGRERAELNPEVLEVVRRRHRSRSVTKRRGARSYLARLEREKQHVLEHDRLPPVRKAPRGTIPLRAMVSVHLEQWEYDDMLEAQDFRCALCRSRPRGRRLAVDHDHLTGIVRGLLCQNCNMALGLFGDNPNALTAAAKYVRKWRQGLEVGAIRRDLNTSS